MPAVSKSTKSILRVIQVVLQVAFNIIFYIVVIIAVVRLSTEVYDFSYQIFGNVSAEEAPGRTISFEIKKGESPYDLSKRLKSENVVVNPYSFAIRAKLTVGSRQPILSGTYKLNTSMTYDEILAIITNTEQKNSNEDGDGL